MPNLANEFRMLIEAANQGRFEEALAISMMAEQPARFHPLNFVAIRAEDGRGLGLRLHLWDDQFAFGQRGFEVHDHVFDLDSFVVRGAVRQTLYEVDSAEDGEYSAYEVQYEENAALLKPVRDHLKLRATRVDDFAEGAHYSLKPGILHRLEPLTSIAKTLVLTRTYVGRPVSIGPTRSSLSPRTERPVIADPAGRAMTIAEHGLDAILAAAHDAYPRGTTPPAGASPEDDNLS